jgi:hypothetical protein
LLKSPASSRFFFFSMETGASERLEADTRVRDPETGDIYTVVTEVTDKTAWQGGFWDGPTWVEDTTSVITLPLGQDGADVVVPRLTATDARYRTWAGTSLSPESCGTCVSASRRGASSRYAA